MYALASKLCIPYAWPKYIAHIIYNNMTCILSESAWAPQFGLLDIWAPAVKAPFFINHRYVASGSWIKQKRLYN